jgi:hypothetical protein
MRQGARFPTEHPATLETRGQLRSARFPGPDKWLIPSCKTLEDNGKAVTGRFIVGRKPWYGRDGVESSVGQERGIEACLATLRTLSTPSLSPCHRSLFQR